MENITMALNSTFDEFNYTKLSYIPYSDRPETYIVPFFFSLFLIVAVTGNGIVVLIVLRHASMRNAPNIYFLSLALADLLGIVTYVPLTTTIYVVDSWPFGLLVCKVSEFAKDITVGVSIFTLVALSADRYLATVNPMRKLHSTGNARRSARFAALIWCLSGACAVPALFSYIRTDRPNKEVNFKVCNPFPSEFGPDYPRIIVAGKFTVYYLAPVAAIGVFYFLMVKYLLKSTRNIPGEMQGQETLLAKQIKARKKVAWMVLTMVITFAVCFLPQHVFLLWFYNNPNALEDYNTFWHVFRIVGFCLTFANSCINPIALYIMSGSFRKYFRRYLSCCCRPKSIRRNSTMRSRRRELCFSMTTSRRHDSPRRCNENIIEMTAWQTSAGQIRKRFLPNKETTI